MSIKILRLKKNAHRRLQQGHVWIYSNEIDVSQTPLKNFSAGEEVIIQTSNQTDLGIAYVNPNSLIAARLFTQNVKERLDTAFFAKQIKTALSLRSRIFHQPYYRLIFSEGDGLPGLIVDRYGKTLVLQLNTAGMDLKKDHLISALLETIPDLDSILLRNDTHARQQEGLETHITSAYGSPPQIIELEENSALFMAPLWEGQKTGWFYDHRYNRARLKDYVDNQRVLDVFSYMGGWGIQAAKYGAKEVMFIDTSQRSLPMIQQNLHLNSIQCPVEIIIEDAFIALKNLSHQKKKFDVIILDPPAFIKKSKDKKEGLIAYQRLNEAAIKLLDDDGILFSCSCSMHLSEEDLMGILRRASFRAQAKIQILERGHQAADHPIHPSIPETNYLKMIVIRKMV